ncbi:MAG: SIMPL domain-containing protein [Romboutsia sp.]
MQYRNTNYNMHSNNGILSVIGSGIIETESNLAILSIGITTEDKSVENAQNANDKIFNNIIKSLSEYGVSSDDISTQDISVIRNYDYNTNTFISYKISHIVSVSINDFSKLSDVYSLAIENGANDNITIDFTLSDQNIYYNKALKKASIDAINKASILAKNFGIKYNPIPYKIKENSSSLYAVSKSSPNFQDILPGLIKISAEIEAIFTTNYYS